jgi:5-methylcytosine-specific restriction endonuclease McrA
MGRGAYLTKVVVRDKFKSCFICGSEEDLTVHHYFGYSKYPAYRNHTGNLVRLCHKCHLEFEDRMDNLYGKGYLK